MSNDTAKTDRPRPKACPICGKPAAAEFGVFCSRRCADIDLNRWLSGVYVVPGKPEEAEDGDEAGTPDASDDAA